MEKQKKISGYYIMMWGIVLLAMLVAFYFCAKKEGYHYDEYYSYYSTNITNGMGIGDLEWKPVEEIQSEFMALDGEGLNLGLVKLNQSFDVHPPMYYYCLRIVSRISKNTFSKWQGLAINLIFYFACLLLLWKIADILGKGNKLVNAFTLLIFAFSPGYLSTITFIRMYVMLTAECFGVLLVVLSALKNDRWDYKRVYIPTVALTFLGFMTHYYFAIFMFFLAAYTCIYLFFIRKCRKQALIYGFSAALAIGLGVLYYPSCLAHIFVGYRGNEATESFLDASNTMGRIGFFTDLLNDYTFGGAFYIIAIIILMGYILLGYLRKKKPGEYKKTDAGVVLTTLVTVSFYLIVCKTGMMPSNPPEALRYECPSYGLIIMLVVLAVVSMAGYVGKKPYIPAIIVLMPVIMMEIYGLKQDKVFFIYEGAEDNCKWAEQHRDETVVYIYNPNNNWMVWNDSSELMNYEKIYFVDMNHTALPKDDVIDNSDKVYVYTCRCDNSESIMESIIANNDNLNEYQQVGERLFVDIYELK